MSDDIERVAFEKERLVEAGWMDTALNALMPDSQEPVERTNVDDDGNRTEVKVHGWHVFGSREPFDTDAKELIWTGLEMGRSVGLLLEGIDQQGRRCGRLMIAEKIEEKRKPVVGDFHGRVTQIEITQAASSSNEYTHKMIDPHADKKDVGDTDYWLDLIKLKAAIASQPGDMVSFKDTKNTYDPTASRQILHMTITDVYVFVDTENTPFKVFEQENVPPEQRTSVRKFQSALDRAKTQEYVEGMLEQTRAERIQSGISRIGDVIWGGLQRVTDFRKHEQTTPENTDPAV